MNGLNWTIEHQCPQCGAPAILEETDRIFACPFCRTRLYISAVNHLRYCIPPGAASDETIFVPYWRVQGLTYSFEPLTMNSRYIDTSASAVDIPGLPPSLGLRPQAMTLKFVLPETPGAFLKPIKTIYDRIPAADRSAIGSHHSLFIGESVSLIYTPMFLKQAALYDAILQRPVTPWHPETALRHPPEEASPALRFVPVLCPQCGWDLAGEKDTLVLACGNCNTAWACEKGVFRQIPFAVVKGAAAPLIYLPFWRIKPCISGLSAASFADFIRLANLPRIVTAAMEDRPLYFWSPAFKVNPALFLRWSRQMTIFQPENDLDTQLPASTAHPVNLALAEAMANILVILGSTVTDKRMFYRNMHHIRIDPGESLLVYQPFVIDRREFRHEKMGLVIEKNALRYGATM